MTFIDVLKTLVGREDPMATVVWACDPLLVVDEHGNQVYAQGTDVEFTPDAPASTTGVARAAKPGAKGVAPEIKVQQRLNEMISVDVDIRTRGGFTLVGEDREGHDVTWYIGRAADRFLLNR